MIGNRLDGVGQARQRLEHRRQLAVDPLGDPGGVLEQVVGLVSLALVLSGRNAQAGPLLGQLTFLAFAVYRLLPALQQIFAATVRMRAESAALAICLRVCPVRRRGATGMSDHGGK